MSKDNKDTKYSLEVDNEADIDDDVEFVPDEADIGDGDGDADGEYDDGLPEVPMDIDPNKKKINSVESRMSSDFLSYYEIARILGDRTAHITHGAPIYVDKKIGISNSDNLNPMPAAMIELVTGKIPFKISREHLDGSIDVWNVSDMNVLLPEETFQKYIKM
jgi:DNA-directed RNA polymerase subunit K/omega